MTTRWQSEAACRGMDPDMFFPARGEDIRPIVATCDGCRVKDACLEHGLRHELGGIWGGTSAEQRRVLRRVRRIAIETPEIAAEALYDARRLTEAERAS